MRRASSSLAVVSVLVTAACGGDPSTAYDPDEDRSVYDAEVDSADVFDRQDTEPYEETASLPDGRDIRLWYSRDGARLLEQHRAPGDGPWTAPATLLESEEPDPCQGITVTEEDGVVAVVADFGRYCYDGEPPSESVAAVATGDLTEWDVHVTSGFDGWSEVRISDGEVRWTRDDDELTWSTDDGFSTESD